MARLRNFSHLPKSVWSLGNADSLRAYRKKGHDPIRHPGTEAETHGKSSAAARHAKHYKSESCAAPADECVAAERAST